MVILKIIFLALIILIALAFIIAVVLTTKTQHSSDQVDFLIGILLQPLPDGFWRGEPARASGWQGKKFNAAQNTGINVFKNGDKNNERAEFKIFTGPAIRDKNLQVLKIDYNRPENPWYLRPLLDEAVQTAPGTMLGKIHYRTKIGTISVGFFKLTNN